VARDHHGGHHSPRCRADAPTIWRTIMPLTCRVDGMPATTVARVLVADDSDSLRQLVSYALRRDGHTVSEASDGGQVLQMLTTERFDVAVLDVMMPVIDGLSLCRLVRSTPALHHLSIIVLSAAIPEADAIAAGAHVFMSKPYRLATVRAAVKALVGSGHTVSHTVREQA